MPDMTAREQERLSYLLLRMSEQTWVTGKERDHIAAVRQALWERVEGER